MKPPPPPFLALLLLNPSPCSRLASSLLYYCNTFYDWRGGSRGCSTISHSSSGFIVYLLNHAQSSIDMDVFVWVFMICLAAQGREVLRSMNLSSLLSLTKCATALPILAATTPRQSCVSRPSGRPASGVAPYSTANRLRSLVVLLCVLSPKLFISRMFI